MAVTEFEHKIVKPCPALSPYVEHIWMLVNHSETAQEVSVLPDGKVDILFSYLETGVFQTKIISLDRTTRTVIINPKSTTFGISLKLLGVEYLLDKSISKSLKETPTFLIEFLDIKDGDLSNFECFHNKITYKITKLLNFNVDPRKEKLFDLIYTSNGAMTVKELSEKVFWTSRQINRYFNQNFGISLKAYCTILRFKASVIDIKDGNLYPQQNFADQAHFIKDINRFSGVAPKELSKNKNDRFIQFSLLPKK
jgi:AraC-like DNA-binding protein